ncbi:uncharacterized protein LOC118186970 isoform X2 [Stegodyphus dumicola]|uniref:uncharacterized protein LOC118186970 isoform X2 n=1 Tax=Stegodyphus dumicola TaxID=202533 RepID=UPI0015B086A6|nr:uncharacterized protein LOC118186970 isoform X2 [Stegodyphus dumicola]
MVHLTEMFGFVKVNFTRKYVSRPCPRFLHVIFFHESLRIMHGKSEFHGINNSKHNEIENKITGIQTKSDLDIYRKLNSHALTIKDLFDSERQFLHNSNLSIFLIIKNTFDSKKLSIFAMPFSLSTIKKIYDLKNELINNWNKSIFFDDKDHVQFQGRRILCLLCSLFIDDNEYIRFQEEFFCGCNSDIFQG